LEKDLVFGLKDRNRRQLTRWTDEIRRTLTMNWHDTAHAKQNRTQQRGLIYKAVENRKLPNENT
jgi:cytochrome P450